MLRFALTALLGTLVLSAAASVVPAAPINKPRLVVLTDIENEPDDTQSLVRLLLYANDIELRGLVATTVAGPRRRWPTRLRPAGHRRRAQQPRL